MLIFLWESCWIYSKHFKYNHISMQVDSNMYKYKFVEVGLVLPNTFLIRKN